MKTVEELNKIRAEKRIELDLRKNTNADTREKHILVCQGTGCTSSKSPQILENFKKIIDKAMIACQNSEISVEDCFTDISKPIISGKWKQELIKDYKLTRYACYLIAQNGDSRKK